MHLLEDVAELFERPATHAEYERQFAGLLADRLPLTFCAIAMRSHDALELAAAAGKNGARALAEVAVANGCAREALATGEPQIADSTLFLPLPSGAGVEGVVVMRRKARAFAPADIRQLQACVRVFGLAVGNAHLALEVERLIDRSTDDRLTGTHNRHGFDERLRTDWKRAMRDGTSVAVAIIDIDHCREYESKYGPRRRDECLRHVARAIGAAGLRSGDYIARLGAQEFAVIMPGAEEEGALALCDRIRRFAALRNIEHAASPYGIVTVSIGVASATPSKERPHWSLLAQADVNLDRAKHAGRNRVAGNASIRTSPLPVTRAFLPPALEPLVGRTQELQALAGIDAPWITIAGPAGIGKTALALEFARRGTCSAAFVSLAGATGSEVAARIDEAIRNGPHDEIHLLLLDHCDDMLAAIAEYGVRGRDGDRVRVVATCRTPLHVAGEAIFELGALPPNDAAVFFEQRAGALDPDLVELCAGVPFMLEFAACTVGDRPDSAYASLLAADDAIDRVVAGARAVVRGRVKPDVKLRALAIAAKGALIAGDRAGVEEFAAGLDAMAHLVESPQLRRRVAALEFVRLAYYGDDREAGGAEGVDLRVLELERVCRNDDDLPLLPLMAGAIVAWRYDHRDAARGIFHRLLRAIRSGSAPHLAATAVIEAAQFSLAEKNPDEALSLLFDASRRLRHAPVAAAIAEALDAYVYAALLHDGHETATRLHAFVTAYRRDRAKPRSPFAQSRYDAILDRHGLAADPPAPDLAGAAQAFELALTI